MTLPTVWLVIHFGNETEVDHYFSEAEARAAYDATPSHKAIAMLVQGTLPDMAPEANRATCPVCSGKGQVNTPKEWHKDKHPTLQTYCCQHCHGYEFISTDPRIVYPPDRFPWES